MDLFATYRSVAKSSCTRIGRLPRDIRKYILEPYLCEETRGPTTTMISMLGVEHSPYREVDGCLIRIPSTVNTQSDLRRWTRYGVPHRRGGPAILSNGDIYWYKYGRLHRRGAPAEISRYGGQISYKHDQIHSYNDMPAIIEWNGRRSWYHKGVPHRSCGPALICSYVEWYTNGTRIRCENRDGTIEQLRRPP